MILVAGGSGFIGAAAVRRLVADGEDVVVLTAHPSRSGRRIAALGARAVAGDVLDEASLAPALSGADVVVQALTFPTFPVERPRRGYTFEAFDGRGKAGFRYAFARFHFWRLTARVGDRTVWDVEHDPVMNGNRFANPAAMKKVYNSYHAELGK